MHGPEIIPRPVIPQAQGLGVVGGTVSASRTGNISGSTTVPPSAPPPAGPGSRPNQSMACTRTTWARR